MSKRKVARCTFCGRGKDEVEKVFVHGDLGICNECIKRFAAEKKEADDWQKELEVAKKIGFTPDEWQELG